MNRIPKQFRELVGKKDESVNAALFMLKRDEHPNLPMTPELFEHRLTEYLAEMRGAGEQTPVTQNDIIKALNIEIRQTNPVGYKGAPTVAVSWKLPADKEAAESLMHEIINAAGAVGAEYIGHYKNKNDGPAL